MNIYLHASVVYLCAICSQRVPVKLFLLVYPVGRTRCVINDLPYVSTVNHEIHFAWQAQYLVKLEDDSCCFAHCK